MERHGLRWLAVQMLRSLKPPATGVSDEEVFRRMREAEENVSIMLTHEEFPAGIKRLAF